MRRTGQDQSCSRTRQFLNRLVREEDGALIILSLQLFLFMMVCTGIAIDFVRVEEKRNVIQNTLDRAVLAAASLSQNVDPGTVVKDYLAKAGLEGLDVDITVEQGTFKEWRRVTVKTTDRMPTIFGPLFGIEDLAAAGNSQATESIGNVEISLVLDVSGSMNYNIYRDGSYYAGQYPTRMDQLRPAALNFVADMFETVQPPSAPAGRLSISVVPYNQQVVLGTKLGSVFNLSTEHTKNTCADVTLLPSTSVAISPTTQLTRTMYGDSFDYWGQEVLGQGDWTLKTAVTNENCKETTAAVLAFANNKTTIDTYIKALRPEGDTAIDVGARWGLALLDPAARPAVNSMITKGWASSDLSGRPFDYDDGNRNVDETAMKVMVLMTDGQNTRSYSTKPAYRTGASGFVSTRSATAFPATSVYPANSRSDERSDWNALYYYDESQPKPYYSMRYDKWLSGSEIWGTKYPISWETIWAKNYSLQGFIEHFYERAKSEISAANTNAKLYADMAIQSEFSGKDTALEAICTAAKDDSRNIVIFTVAVDAPEEGKAILRRCATAETYAYEVSALDLTNAFASIASAINSLRLTN